MKFLQLMVLSGTFLAACNNGGGKEIQGNDTTANADSPAVIAPLPNAADTVISGCYSLIYKRDTAMLQLEVKGTSATGALTYSLYEKDRNDGTFQGEVSGDQLQGWYLFHSEGVMSVRQVIWKIDRQHLWPASGEMVQQNDSMFFAHPDALKYDSTRAFVKVKCLL